MPRSIENSDLAQAFRMPRWFGPLPGPRNLPFNRRALAGDNDTTTVAVAARTDRDALQALLPPRCTVWGDPQITVSAMLLTNLGWLAGRGYNIISVSIPVEFDEGDGIRRGEFVPVLWESHADPILTGRDELGFSKLFAAIQATGSNDSRYDVFAHWEGFRFAALFADDLVEGASGAPRRPASEGSLHYKFVPRCGDPATADVEYMVLMPPPMPSAAPLEHGHVSVRQFGGRGEFRFTSARWEDMPTQYPVVNALADLPLHEFLGASLTISSVRGVPERAMAGAQVLR